MNGTGSNQASTPTDPFGLLETRAIATANLLTGLTEEVHRFADLPSEVDGASALARAAVLLKLEEAARVFCAVLCSYSDDITNADPD